MTNHGSDNEPDIWANTGNPPLVPPTPDAPATPAPPIVDLPTGAADPTRVQPTTPGEMPPTAVQPAAPGPVDMPPPAGAPGFSTGPGAPPPRQPPLPPTGGPGGPGGPGPDDPESDRPAWLMPAAVGLFIAVVAAGVVFFMTRGDDDPDIITTEETTTSITETTIEIETTLPPETTIATETTVGVETTIAAETTLAPDTTAAPTTAPPTTTAPETTAPDGIPPAAPGTALIAGQTYPISSGCTITPIDGFSVTSYLINDGDPGTLVERVLDGASASGGYSEFGLPQDTEGYEDLGDNGFGMIVTQGDNGFEVALNPTGISVGDCTAKGSVTIGEGAGYDYGIVDICTLASPFTMVGYLTEGGRVQMTDNGDGTATVSFDTTELFLGSDPAAAFTNDGGRVQVTGQIDASTFDGDTTQAISIGFDNTSPRSCGEFETT